MAQCIQKFKLGPTYIETEFLSQNEAEFPALTICPETIRYKEDVLKQHGIPTVKQYTLNPILTWSSNQTNVTEVQLFEMATNRFDELVKQFVVRFIHADVSNFKKIQIIHRCHRSRKKNQNLAI